VAAGEAGVVIPSHHCKGVTDSSCQSFLCCVCLWLQGEAGVVIPSDGYLAEAQKLLHKHNALLIADEVQTGLCRTGDHRALSLRQPEVTGCCRKSTLL
jgi:acetylornithine/succinyldiaminopimelate/putrescine aminotransferase